MGTARPVSARTITAGKTVEVALDRTHPSQPWQGWIACSSLWEVSDHTGLLPPARWGGRSPAAVRCDRCSPCASRPGTMGVHRLQAQGTADLSGVAVDGDGQDLGTAVSEGLRRRPLGSGRVYLEALRPVSDT